MGRSRVPGSTGGVRPAAREGGGADARAQCPVDQWRTASARTHTWEQATADEGFEVTGTLLAGPRAGRYVALAVLVNGSALMFELHRICRLAPAGRSKTPAAKWH